MKQKIGKLVFLLCVLGACRSGAPSAGESAPVSASVPVTGVPVPVIEASVQVAETPPAPAPAEDKSFHPESISDEVYAAAKTDVKNLIAALNKVIRARDYAAWLSHLSDSYLKEIKSPAFLSRKTEELYDRGRMIAKLQGKDLSRVPRVELKTPKDYFNYVVVPSRKNDHVEDIEYISENEVIAWTQNGARAKPEILYYLENTGGTWKITNPPQQNEKK